MYKPWLQVHIGGQTDYISTVGRYIKNKINLLTEVEEILGNVDFSKDTPLRGLHLTITTPQTLGFRTSGVSLQRFYGRALQHGLEPMPIEATFEAMLEYKNRQENDTIYLGTDLITIETGTVILSMSREPDEYCFRAINMTFDSTIDVDARFALVCNVH